MFFASAVMVGLAMVIFESFVSSKVFKRSLEKGILIGLAKAEVFVILAYFLLRIIDVIVRGALPAAFAGNMEGNMFLAEMIVGVVLPLILLAIPSVRGSIGGVFFCSLMVIIGLILNRMNVSVIGMLRESKASYFPSLMEFAITAAVIAGGLLAFKIAVKYFDIFHSEEKKPA
jgi:Ni/Fe-hydrogenase subunit HybB-like protein